MSQTSPTRTSRSTRLAIDWTRCDGHGLCAALLPQAITLDEWGFPIIDAAVVAAMPPSAIRRTALACPALALRMEKP
jgi:ferredoxin